MKIYRIANGDMLHVEKEELPDRTRYYLKDGQGKIVGKLVLQMSHIPRDEKLYITQFKIEEEYRGKGYGRMLMEELIGDSKFREKDIVVFPASYEDDDPRYSVENLTEMYSHFGFKPSPVSGLGARLILKRSKTL